jgi:CO dehydrogenase/acetyl-CoA synthase delta subunit
MIDKNKLHDALRKMGRKYVKPLYRDVWTPECPTTGYCYVVAEVVYHHLAPKGSRPYVMKTGDRETHWFIRDPQGNVIDLTADQFDKPLDYSEGKPANFLTKQLSKRGQILANLLGLN